MGGRGSFLSIDSKDFMFVDGGQTFYSIGEKDGVEVLVRPNGSVKAPEFSHTKSRIYAIVQNGYLKHLTFYGEDHKQKVSIDLLHPHGDNKLKPHKHLNLNHNDKGIPVTESEMKLINRIKREFNLK